MTELDRIKQKLAAAGLIVQVDGKWVATETGKAYLERLKVKLN
jgi:hypothetical protein